MTSKQLKRRIAALGFSQAGFARYVEADQRTVRRWCSGEQDIPRWVPVMLHLLEELHGQRAGRTAPGAATVVPPFPDREIGRNLEDNP